MATSKDSNDEAFSKMWRIMQREQEEVLMPSNAAGVNKVVMESGKYAFFMESSTIEYIVERNCKLQKIGGNLDSKSYGIALPQGGPLKALYIGRYEWLDVTHLRGKKTMDGN